MDTTTVATSTVDEITADKIAAETDAIAPGAKGPPPKTEREAAVVAHMVAAVEAAEVSNHPFSHFYVRNLFPADFYAEILANLPAKSAYEPLNLKAWSRPDGESTRDRLILSKEVTGRLPPAERDFWRSLTTILTSPELKVATFRKLKKDLALRFDVAEAAADAIPAFPRCTLMRDSEGYRIKPHTDGLEKIVTMQLYLPPDDSQRHVGTVLYEEDSSLVAKLTRKSFKKYRQFDFLPNSGYAFAVNNRRDKRSWHGVETLGGDVGIRNTILNLYRVNADEEYY